MAIPLPLPGTRTCSVARSGAINSGVNWLSVGSAGWLVVFTSGGAGSSESEGISSVFRVVNGSPAWSDAVNERRSSVNCDGIAA